MKIINNTDDTIIANFDDDFFVKFPANETTEFELKNGSCKSVILREEKEKLSFSGALLAFFIAIPLSIMNYFNYEKIEESIKLPTRFFLPEKKSIDSFEIKKSVEEMKNYAVYVDEKMMNSELFFTTDELKEEVKSYKYSNILMLLLPFLILTILDIYFWFTKQIGSGVTVLLLLAIITVPVLLRFTSNKKTLKSIKNKSIDCSQSSDKK